MRRARGPARKPAEPWPVIPAGIADQLRPRLPELVEEMVAEIHLTVAEYARPDDDRYARAVRRGAEEAAQQFLDRIANPDAPWDRAAAVFRSLGSAEADEGRSLEALESALRAGARVALRWLTQASRLAEAPLETLGFLAEALFVFLDKTAGQPGCPLRTRAGAAGPARGRAAPGLIRLFVTVRDAGDTGAVRGAENRLCDG